MDTSTLEAEDLAQFALGKRGRRNTRIRRALLARLVNEQAENGEEPNDNGSAAEGDDEEGQLVRLLTGSRLLKRRRLRRLVLANLLSEHGGEAEEIDEEEAEDDGEAGGDDHELARLLVGNRMLRRHRVRRALLAHLIRQRGATDEETDDGEEEFEGEDGGERKFVRMVIGSRILRKRRVRRALIAKLLSERSDAGEESEDDDEDTDEGTDLERQVARLLIGRRMIKRRGKRRAIAHYLREN